MLHLNRRFYIGMTTWSLSLRTGDCQYSLFQCIKTSYKRQQRRKQNKSYKTAPTTPIYCLQAQAMGPKSFVIWRNCDRNVVRYMNRDHLTPHYKHYHTLYECKDDEQLTFTIIFEMCYVAYMMRKWSCIPQWLIYHVIICCSCIGLVFGLCGDGGKHFWNLSKLIRLILYVTM